MAITTLDQAITGLLPTYSLFREINNVISNDPQYLFSFFNPGVQPSTASGNVLLNSDAGAIPFSNPVSGNTYLAGLKVSPMSNFTLTSRKILMIDRLWHGLLSSTTSLQTVNSVTFPARDNNGSTDGDGVYLAIEVGPASNTSGPDWGVTVTYTNSAGVAGRTATVLSPYVQALLREYRWYHLKLQSGDVGVRSVQDVTFTAAVGVNTNIVAYRALTHLYCQTTANGTGVDDVVSLGMPRIYNGSYLMFVYGNYLNGGINVASSFEVTLTQG
jgi:hypothetical protein